LHQSSTSDYTCPPRLAPVSTLVVGTTLLKPYPAHTVPIRVYTPRTTGNSFSELRCLLMSPALRSNAGMANRQGDAQVSAPQLELWLGLVTAFFSDSWPLKMRPICCPQTLATNYHYALRNSPEERSSNLLGGGSLKSRTQWFRPSRHARYLYFCEHK
jgi:hypothetical protein